MKMKPTFPLLAAAVMMLAPVGCSTLTKKPTTEAKNASFFDKMPWIGKNKQDETPEAYPEPVKLAATWTPDTLVQQGRTPTRGFGGRVFFYDQKSRPVPVDGTLIVHGFDDTATKQEDRVKRFEFTPEQFTRHFSQTDLGASYSVWIPWDAIGGTQRRVSLVASFKATDGKLVQGIPATILLPGPTDKSEASEMAKLSPQYRKYRQAADSPSARSSGLTTTTISRRGGAKNGVTKPGITIPSVHDPAEMIAKSHTTPAIDVQMLGKRKPTPRVMPASAQLPLQR